MSDNAERPRLGRRSNLSSFKELMAKVAALAMGLGLLVVGLVFSLLLFAAVVAIGLAAWAYIWWKTRERRRTLRNSPPGGRVVEGEVLRDSEIR